MFGALADELLPFCATMVVFVFVFAFAVAVAVAVAVTKGAFSGNAALVTPDSKPVHAVRTRENTEVSEVAKEKRDIILWLLVRQPGRGLLLSIVSSMQDRGLPQH